MRPAAGDPLRTCPECDTFTYGGAPDCRRCVRRPHATSAQELLARRALLPYLLVGILPTTAEAQAFSAALKADPTPERAAELARRLLDG